MRLYLHPESLSPDPLYGRRAGRPRPGGRIATLHPHACLRTVPAQQQAWQRRLDMFTPPPPARFRPGADRRIEIILDFGAELEAELDLHLHAFRAPLHAFVTFGESLAEAEGAGIPTTNPCATLDWRIPGPGPARRRFPARGFRFVRIQFPEAPGPVTLQRAAAIAWFAFPERKGDFLCDRPRFQRLWQTSVYTARLCSRPDAYWDGIKRDRVGWYGDARITQMTTDAAFLDPAPAAGMLARLPVAEWSMGIPGYSFAAIAMLHQLVLCHGLSHPCVRDVFERVRSLLAWVRRTQLDADGFIRRDPDAHYFGRIAFVDWSPLPVGGQFEELSWLQCQHVEGLRLAAELAAWLNRPRLARTYNRQAQVLGDLVRQRFWRRGAGMIHTLNQTTREWKPLVVLPLPEEVDNEYRRLYLRLPPIGPSLPSRHSQTLAVLAGLVSAPEDRQCVLRTLRSSRTPPLITAYFGYFQAVARAECGDPAGALADFESYLADMIEPDDCSTLWEWHDPAVRDFRRWALGDWPKSLCHAWSSGLAPLTQRYLFGIRPIAPGFAHD